MIGHWRHFYHTGLRPRLINLRFSLKKVLFSDLKIGSHTLPPGFNLVIISFHLILFMLMSVLFVGLGYRYIALVRDMVQPLLQPVPLVFSFIALAWIGIQSIVVILTWEFSWNWPPSRIVYAGLSNIYIGFLLDMFCDNLFFEWTGLFALGASGFIEAAIAIRRENKSISFIRWYAFMVIVIAIAPLFEARLRFKFIGLYVVLPIALYLWSRFWFHANKGVVVTFTTTAIGFVDRLKRFLVAAAKTLFGAGVLLVVFGAGYIIWQQGRPYLHDPSELSRFFPSLLIHFVPWLPYGIVALSAIILGWLLCWGFGKLIDGLAGNVTSLRDQTHGGAALAKVHDLKKASLLKEK